MAETCNNCCEDCKCSRKWLCGTAMVLLLGCSLIYSYTSKASEPDNRFLTVISESEQEMNADFAVWNIYFQITGQSLAEVNEKLKKDRASIIAFLKEQGFSDEEVDILDAVIKDKRAKEYGEDKPVNEKYRYILQSKIKVSSKNVDRISKASQKASVLLEQDVTLSQPSFAKNPKFYIKDSSEVEKKLYDEALQKGETIAQNMAIQTKVKLLNVRNVEPSNKGKGVEFMSSEDSGKETYGDNKLKGPKKLARLSLKITYNIK
jgi:hypothetical protein